MTNDKNRTLIKGGKKGNQLMVDNSRNEFRCEWIKRLLPSSLCVFHTPSPEVIRNGYSVHQELLGNRRTGNVQTEYLV